MRVMVSRDTAQMFLHTVSVGLCVMCVMVSAVTLHSCFSTLTAVSVGLCLMCVMVSQLFLHTHSCICRPLCDGVSCFCTLTAVSVGLCLMVSQLSLHTHSCICRPVSDVCDGVTAVSPHSQLYL